MRGRIGVTHTALGQTDPDRPRTRYDAARYSDRRRHHPTGGGGIRFGLQIDIACRRDLGLSHRHGRLILRVIERIGSGAG